MSEKDLILIWFPKVFCHFVRSEGFCKGFLFYFSQICPRSPKWLAGRRSFILYKQDQLFHQRVLQNSNSKIIYSTCVRKIVNWSFFRTQSVVWSLLHKHFIWGANVPLSASPGLTPKTSTKTTSSCSLCTRGNANKHLPRSRIYCMSVFGNPMKFTFKKVT